MTDLKPQRLRRMDNQEFRVIRLRELPVPMACCDTPQRIYEYCMANISTASWYTPDAEIRCAIHQNTRRRATGFHLVGIGSLDSVLITPRELFRTAMAHNAAASVVAQSPPNRDDTPSQTDIHVTRGLVQAGRSIFRTLRAAPPSCAR